MTEGEKDALRVAVQQCWNVGSLSSEALRTTVTVGVSVAQDGMPDAGSISMIGFEGGSEAAARQAYEAARRAIIRCGENGFSCRREVRPVARDRNGIQPGEHEDQMTLFKNAHPPARSGARRPCRAGARR